MTTNQEPKRKIIVFDDKSVQFQVLEAEKSKDKTKELVKVPVNADPSKKIDLVNDYFTKIDQNTLKDDVVKIELHFTLEDYDKYDLDNQINELRNKYKNVGFIKTYALMSRQKLERLAQKIGVTKEEFKTKEQVPGIEAEQKKAAQAQAKAIY